MTDILKRFGPFLIWIAFLSGLTFVFGWLLDKQNNPNQANITRVASDGAEEVVLQRNRQGHYVASGLINGQEVEFFLDTGATSVSIPEKVAKRLELKRGAEMTSITANGEIKVYAAWLDRISLGHITLENVRATINPHSDEEDILLGMSFLKHLELVQRGENLRLRVPRE